MTRNDLATAILSKVQGELLSVDAGARSLANDGGILIAPVAALTVTELLSQSRAQHMAYRAALPRRNTQGAISDGDSIAADAAFIEAARLRAQAELADAQHTDLAWTNEPDTHNHDELLNFYLDVLSR